MNELGFIGLIIFASVTGWLSGYICREIEEKRKKKQRQEKHD